MNLSVGDLPVVKKCICVVFVENICELFELVFATWTFYVCENENMHFCFCFSSFFLSVEAEAKEPAAEADHGPASQPHLGDQLHAGCQELSRTRARAHSLKTHMCM